MDKELKREIGQTSSLSSRLSLNLLSLIAIGYTVEQNGLFGYVRDNQSRRRITLNSQPYAALEKHIACS